MELTHNDIDIMRIRDAMDVALKDIDSLVAPNTTMSKTDVCQLGSLVIIRNAILVIHSKLQDIYFGSAQPLRQSIVLKRIGEYKPHLCRWLSSKSVQKICCMASSTWSLAADYTFGHNCQILVCIFANAWNRQFRSQD